MDDKRTVEVLNSVVPGTSDYKQRMIRKAEEEYLVSASMRSSRPSKKVNKLKVNLKKLVIMGMVFTSAGVVVVKGSPYVGKAINYMIELDNKNFEEENNIKNALVQEQLASELGNDSLAQQIFIDGKGSISGVEAIEQANEIRSAENNEYESHHK